MFVARISTLVPSREMLRLARFLQDRMPGVAAGAAVAPCDRRVAAKYLFDADVMFVSAFRTDMRDTGLFRLTR